MTRWLASLAVALGAAASVWLFAAEPATDAQMQARADQLFADGNFKDAYELFHKLALQADTPPAVAAHAVGQGTSSLVQLGRKTRIEYRNAAAGSPLASNCAPGKARMDAVNAGAEQ